MVCAKIFKFYCFSYQITHFRAFWIVMIAMCRALELYAMFLISHQIIAAKYVYITVFVFGSFTLSEYDSMHCSKLLNLSLFVLMFYCFSFVLQQKRLIPITSHNVVRHGIFFIPETARKCAKDGFPHGIDIIAGGPRDVV